MAKRKFKATAKRSLAVLSSLAVLLSCGTTGLLTATAAEVDTADSSAGESVSAKRIKIYDEYGNDLTPSDDAEPIIYVDNSYQGGGRYIRNLDIRIEGGDGDQIKCQAEPQPKGKEHILLSQQLYSDDHLGVSIWGAEPKGGKLVRLTPGTTHIYFSTVSGEVYQTLTVVVYSPAKDATIYMDKDTELSLNDENLNNDIDLIAVANHQYQFTYKLDPTDSTDEIDWQVYDGDFVYENLYVPGGRYEGIYRSRYNENEIINGYVPQATTKAEITSGGYFTAKEQGTVTIVARPKATETSSRETAIGEKKRIEPVLDDDGNRTYNKDGTLKTKTVTDDPYLQNLPKYIHVTIAKENPATKLELLNKGGASALQVDQKYQLELKATPTFTGADDEYRTGATDVFNWVSSNKDVATVDEKGLITAVSPGKTKITVYGEKENVYAECDVEVYTPAQAITFDKSEGSMRTVRIDVPIEITARLTPEESNERIVWETADPEIATVEPATTGDVTNVQKAVVSGHKVGTTTVIAKTVQTNSTVDPETGEEIITTENKIVTKLSIDVKEKNLSGSISVERAEGNDYISVPDDSLQTVYTQNQITFRSSLLAANGLAADDTTIWEIADNDDKNLKIQIDSVDGKKVSLNDVLEGKEITLRGVAEGVVTVTAKSKSKPEINQTFQVQVLKGCDVVVMNTVSGSRISNTKPLNIGKLFTVVPDLQRNNINKYDHSDVVASWTSSDPKIATVDEYGNVRGVSIGEATITVTTASGIKGSVKVNVFSPSEVNITGSGIVASANKGDFATLTVAMNDALIGSAKLTGVVKDDKGTTLNNTVECEWSSSNEDVATVSSEGLVTAVDTGTTIITARSGETDKISQVLVTVTAPVKKAAYDELDYYVYSPLIGVYEPKPILYFNDKPLTEGVDYKLSYDKNDTATRNATVRATGMGLYTGTLDIRFTISARDLADEDIIVEEIPAQKCTGNEIRPEINVTYLGIPLEQGVDYTVQYANNRKPGEATITITGKGNYTGKITKKFEIYCNHEELKNIKILKEATHEETGLEQGSCIACGTTVTREIPRKGITENPAAELQFVKSYIGLEATETAKLEYTAIGTDPSKDATDDFDWSSSNDKIVSVDAEGNVKAIKAGTAIITITGEITTAECEVTVLTKATDVIVAPETVNTRVSVAATVTASINPEKSDDVLLWEIEDSDIAELTFVPSDKKSATQSVIITGKQVGTTNLLVSAKYSDITKTIPLTVTERNSSDNIRIVTDIDGTPVQLPTNISGAVYNQTIYTNQDLEFEAFLTTDDGESADDNVVWRISDNDLDFITTPGNDSKKDIVDKKIKIHGASEGVVTVTASSKDRPELEASFTVEVLKGCDKIAVKDEFENTVRSKSLNIGDTISLTGDLTINDSNHPYNHSDFVKSWTSSAPEIAEVDDNGTVRAIKNGSATITLTTASGKTSTVNITVFTTSAVYFSSGVKKPENPDDDPTASIALKKDKDNNLIGTLKLSAEVYDQNEKKVSNVSCNWYSSNEDVATVSETGVVTAVGAGITTITVESGAKEQSCIVTVQAPLTAITYDEIEPYVYSSDVEAYEPDPVIKIGDTVLERDVDYTIVYANNTGVGKATMTIKGIGLYTGEQKITFNILKPSTIGIAGDLDNDNEVTSADALIILRATVGLEKFNDDQKTLADVNSNGEVDSADSLYVLRYVVGYRDKDSLVGKEL